MIELLLYPLDAHARSIVVHDAVWTPLAGIALLGVLGVYRKVSRRMSMGEAKLMSFALVALFGFFMYASIQLGALR
jgi:hypothetical protein